jgi:hypothetical protein
MQLAPCVHIPLLRLFQNFGVLSSTEGILSEARLKGCSRLEVRERVETNPRNDRGESVRTWPYECTAGYRMLVLDERRRTA